MSIAGFSGMDWGCFRDWGFVRLSGTMDIVCFATYYFLFLNKVKETCWREKPCLRRCGELSTYVVAKKANAILRRLFREARMGFTKIFSFIHLHAAHLHKVLV